MDTLNLKKISETEEDSFQITDVCITNKYIGTSADLHLDFVFKGPANK